MDLTRKLQEWGAVQAQVRSAERACAQQTASAAAKEEAQRLRERANHLHREIYNQIGRPSAPHH